MLKPIVLDHSCTEQTRILRYKVAKIQQPAMQSVVTCGQENKQDRGSSH